jgi:hypothetical protein
VERAQPAHTADLAADARDVRLLEENLPVMVTSRFIWNMSDIETGSDPSQGDPI